MINRKITTGFGLRAMIGAVIIGVMLASGGSFAQDAEKGAKVFKKCAACHTVGIGAKNKVGPILNGVVGRPAGQVKGYKYSRPLLESGITWTEGMLTDFVRDTKGLIRGTRMKFAGLDKEDEIADLIAYLEKFDVDGKLKSKERKK